MSILIFLVSFIFSFVAFPLLIPRLKQAGIVGKDMHKPDSPSIPEMGGLGIIVGFSLGLMAAVTLKTFFHTLKGADLISLLAALLTVLMIALIGIFDDLLHIRQGAKAALPLLAALPLMAVKAGDTNISIPFLGQIDFGIFYSLILVPLGVTGAANAVNMLAGFNGLEVGMGVVAMASLAVIAYSLQATTALIILLAALGALLVALYFNWYPAKVFVGDVGTLSIGAIIGSAVIIGNFETAGVILIVPYAIDFLLKALHRFPSTGWWGVYNDGKLYCPESGPVGLCQLIMKIFGGIHERHLVLVLMGLESVFGLIAVLLYVRS